MKKMFFLVISMFICLTGLNAGLNNGVEVSNQRRVQINGTVVDTNGEPIIGANIIEKGTSNGVITDINGSFSLDVSDGAIIVISYIGYIKKELSSSGNFNRIVMEEDLSFLDEVIVVGYGVMKKSDLTGSVQRVNTERFELQ